MKPLSLLLATLVLVGCGAKPDIAQNGGDEPQKPEASGETLPAESATLELTQPAKGDAPVVDKEPAVETHLAGALLFGEYDGKIEFPPGFFEDMKRDAEQNGTLDEAERFEKGIKESKLTLQLKQDGTYSLASMTMGVSETRSGDWVFDPSKQVLTVKKPAGDTDGKDKAFVVDDKGRKLVFVGENEGVRVTITFTRS